MENNILYMEFLSPNMEPDLTSMEAGTLHVVYQSTWNLAPKRMEYDVPSVEFES